MKRIALTALTIMSTSAHATPLPTSHWVWPGRGAGARLAASGELLVLQETIRWTGRKHDAIAFERLGPTARKLSRSAHLTLVIRVEAAAAASDVAREALARVSEWEAIGQAVSAVQIDFDSPTAKLEDYARLLGGIRTRLPARLKLTITGLGDWITSAPPRALALIYASVDEIYFQLYQKDEPVAHEAALVWQLERFSRPFRVGLLPGQLAHAERYSALQFNPSFRGLVEFR